MKEIEKIKETLIQSLELANADGVLEGDYVCHENAPEYDDMFEEYFTACGDSDEYAYFVGIKKIKL